MLGGLFVQRQGEVAAHHFVATVDDAHATGLDAKFDRGPRDP